MGDRLSRNPSNNKIFSASKRKYQRALKHSGYNNCIVSFHQSSKSNAKRQRHRNVIWFNTSYSCAVIINAVKKFLQLLDLGFLPSKKFHGTFSSYNVRLSYWCTLNVGNIVRSHN